MFGKIFAQNFGRPQKLMGKFWKGCFLMYFDLLISNLGSVLAKKFLLLKIEICCVWLSATVPVNKPLVQI